MIAVRSAPAWRRPRISARAVLEELEIRRLLNARFIVPLGVPIDNASTFGTLQTALSTAGLVINDTITIEPGSAPGNIAITVPPAANLTIQGDPTAALASIPMFTLSNALVVGAAQGGLTLKNINLGLISDSATTGSISGTGNLVISGSSIVNLSSSAMFPITLGGNTNVVVNSTFVSEANVVYAFVEVVTPAGGSNNTIARNTFIVNSSYANVVLGYVGGSSVAVTDKVVSNTFIAAAGATGNNFFLLQEGVAGLTIQGNSFSAASGFISINVLSPAQNTTISNNTIDTINDANKSAIAVNAAPSATTGLLIFNNHISAGPSATGLSLSLQTGTSVLKVNVEGNDFHANKEGVRISAVGTASLSGIDLGGGSQGSLGGNNFRSFTGAAALNKGAISVLIDPTNTGSVAAQRNLFANGVTLGTVINDTYGKLVLANPLSGNAAFVETLYEDFLQRPGNTNNGSDAGYWVNAIAGGAMTAAQAAASIAKSPEALGVLVDGLYGRYLGRLPDAGGRSYFIGVLQAPGAGVEAMVTQLVTSAEYTGQFAADSNFIQSLFTRLLGRLGSVSDVTSWVNTLSSAGRAGVVNGFLHSGEFRGDVAKQFYGFAPAPLVATASIFLPLLHRTVAPSAAEINYWANSSQDLLTMDTGFAQTGEYFTSG